MSETGELFTDEYVHTQILEAWEICGQRTFWQDLDKVQGLGKALLRMTLEYQGKWKNSLDACWLNYTLRLPAAIDLGLLSVGAKELMSDESSREEVKP